MTDAAAEGYHRSGPAPPARTRRARRPMGRTWVPNYWAAERYERTSGQVLEVLGLHHEREAVAHVEAVEAQEPGVLLDARLDEVDLVGLRAFQAAARRATSSKSARLDTDRPKWSRRGRRHRLVVGDEVHELLVAVGPEHQPLRSSVSSGYSSKPNTSP